MAKQKKTMTNAFYNWLGPRREKKLINITRAEWIEWWEATGVFDRRGSQKGCAYMSRIDKTEPFSLSNIELRFRGDKKK